MSVWLEDADAAEVAAARVRVAVLGDLLDELEQITGIDAEMPGVDLRRVAGMRAVKNVVAERVTEARQRLAALDVADGRRPVLLDPDELGAIESRQGQPLTPVISHPVAATVGLSSAEVWMPPGHASRAHVHHATDVVVRLIEGRATTLWWDADGRVHELHQRAGEHLHIPRGVPHAAMNPHRRPVVAVEFRSNPDFNVDTTRLPHLEPEVAERLAARRRQQGGAS